MPCVCALTKPGWSSRALASRRRALDGAGMPGGPTSAMLSPIFEGDVSVDGKDVRLTDEQRLDWLRLIRSDNVGPRTFRALIDHCGGASAAVAALPDLARRGGATRPARICSRQDAERELAAAKSLGVSLVASCEPDYPQRLRMIDDAPPLLAIRGASSVLALPMVAIVGAIIALVAVIALGSLFGSF